MLNRRQLRIKILQSLYAFFQSKSDDIAIGKKELLHSVNRMYDMYIYYMLVFNELNAMSILKKEDAKKRLVQNDNNLAVNKYFVENEFVKALSVNKSLKKESEKLKINWVGDVEQDVMMKLFKYITSTKLFSSIISNENSDFSIDKTDCIQLFKKEICNFDLIHNYFEEISIYWVDDIDHVCSMVIKTLKSFEDPNLENQSILPLYKDDEKDFTLKLYQNTISNKEANDKLLAKYTKNWDQDRLAKMDMILMNMAINEARSFSSIPIKVTLNEYIEISKYYSTPKSNGFINGILDNVFEDLKKDGKIVKTGRGLI